MQIAYISPPGRAKNPILSAHNNLFIYFTIQVTRKRQDKVPGHLKRIPEQIKNTNVEL